MELRSEVFQDWALIAGLRGEWTDLLHRSAADSMFLTPEWVEAWLHAGGRSFDPVIVTVREGARLVGLAPLYRTRIDLLGWVSYHTLRVAGDYPTGAVYQDLIVDRERKAEAGEAIVAALAARPGLFDCLWFPSVADWTGASARILSSCRAAGLRAVSRPISFSALSLPASMEEYVASMSRPKRRQLRKELREIMVPGAEVRRCTEAAEVQGFLEALFALHHSRWSRRGELGVFRRKPGEAEFYRRFVPVALERGWLRLFGLFVQGRPRAVQIGYAYGGVLHALQDGFDPDYPGSGNALRAKVLESAIKEALRAADFLIGFTENKRRWLGVARQGCEIFAARRSLKNALPFAVPAWPRGRLFRHPPFPLVPEAGGRRGDEEPATRSGGQE